MFRVVRLETVAFLNLLAATHIYSQKPHDAPQFEVAWIKPSKTDSRLSISPEFKHGTLTAKNITLLELLAVAYASTEPRIIGPDWLGKERFDIAAKTSEDVPEPELPSLLQALLAERFLLRAHAEERVMSVYELEIADGGLKMRPYVAGSASSKVGPQAVGRGYPMLSLSGTTARLASVLSRFLDKPVIDKTGLTDRYEMFVSFSLPSPAASEVPAISPPDIFTALREQLGLKLLSKKTTVEVEVIDHIERNPSEN